MKIKLTNKNLKEIRKLLILKNIKPDNNLSYYLSFGFKSDKESYIFEIKSDIEIIKKETYTIIPIKLKIFKNNK